MDFTDVLIRDFNADADRRMAFICRVMMALMAVVIVLNLVGVFKIGPCCIRRSSSGWR